MLKKESSDPFVSSAVSGSNAISLTTGQRLDLGGGSSDYIYSDGTSVCSPATFRSDGGFNLGTSAGAGSLSPGVTAQAGHIAVINKGFDFALYDSSGSPGAANAGAFPSGKAAVASGAGSVVITTSAARATGMVLITPLGVDTAAPFYKAVTADGSFTVTTYNTAGAATNVAANWLFQWIVFGKSQYE